MCLFELLDVCFDELTNTQMNMHNKLCALSEPTGLVLALRWYVFDDLGVTILLIHLYVAVC